MENKSGLPSVSLCVACLSSNRQLSNIQDHESKLMFELFLNDFEYSSQQILLCYECKGRLRNALKFKRQVNKSQNYLDNYVKNTIPIPLSTIGVTQTEIFYYKPPPTIKKNPQYYKNLQNSNDVSSDDERDYFDNILPVETMQSGTFPSSTFQSILPSGTIQNTLPSGTLEGTLPCGTLNSTLPKGTLQSTLPNNTLQGTFPIGTLPTSTSQSTLPTGTSKSILPISTLPLSTLNTNQSSILINGEDWDIKVEAVEEKVELKTELDDNCEKIEEIILDEKNDSFNDSDDEPLNNIKINKNKVKKMKKEKKGRKSKTGVVQAAWVTKKLIAMNIEPGLIERVILTWEEVELERQQALLNPRYISQQFRCQHCVVGFNHRFKLDAHNNKHSTEAGDLECEICKTRFKTKGALLCHKRRHTTRWRCTVCQSVYSRVSVCADHAARVHNTHTPTHTCSVCAETCTSLSKLRAHMKIHSEKQHCDKCGKIFPDKAALRTHLFIHTDQKDFSCEECGKKFRFKKALEIHRVTHQPSELLYCAECDMNFKNRISFYQHINYSMKHIHPDKIKYACEFCSRRFSKPSRLQEHRLSIHLKLAPHRCTYTGCTFASASRPAVRTHTRLQHKHKRFERNYVCHTCGKTFTTAKILTGHIRSHTGERPFSCSACPATFTHDAALYNHNKLVHKVPFVRRRKNTHTAPTEWTTTASTDNQLNNIQ